MSKARKWVKRVFKVDNVLTTLEALPFVGGLFTATKSQYNNKVNLTASEIDSLLARALSAAKTKGDAALQAVENQLSRLDFARSSPVLDQAVAKRRKQLRDKAAGLRNDIAELDLVGATASADSQRILDDQSKGKQSKINALKEVGKNVQTNIEKIESRL